MKNIKSNLLKQYIDAEVQFMLQEQGVVQRVGQQGLQVLINQFNNFAKKIESYKSNSELAELYKAIQSSGEQVKLPRGFNNFKQTIQQWSGAANTIKPQTVQEHKRIYKSHGISKKHNHLLKEAKLYLNQAEKLLQRQKYLNELADPVTIAGIALAALKVVALAGSGLEKLGEYLQKSTNNILQSLGKFCSWLGHIFHYAHVVEEKIIDDAVPDRLSYYVYRYYWNQGKGEDLHKKYFKNDPAKLEKLKSKEKASSERYLENPEAQTGTEKIFSGPNREMAALSFLEWQEDHILRPKLENTIFHIYILMLFIYALPAAMHIVSGFFSHGISGALHAAHGSAALAAAEPVATGIKAAELGGAAAKVVA